MKKIISLIGVGLVSLIGCNPDVGFEETGSSTSNSTSFSSSGSIDTFGMSETSIDPQVTTSGEVITTGHDSSSDGSDGTGIVMTIVAIQECGDGLVEFPEECDDGKDPSLECTDECKFSVCGDGFLDVANKEECDDGNLNDFDSCSNDCLNNRAAFLTTDFVGFANFGGIEVADEFCQVEAKIFELKGLYKAWLSDDNFETSPLFRFDSEDFQGWYRSLDSKTGIAKGWNDLIDGELTEPINVQSNGSIDNTSLVWTATNFDGTRNINGSCGNWNGIQTGPTFNVMIGDPIFSNEKWTENIESCNDGISKKLYCFQVE